MVPNCWKDRDVWEMFLQSSCNHLDDPHVGVLRLQPDIMGREVSCTQILFSSQMLNTKLSLHTQACAGKFHGNRIVKYIADWSRGSVLSFVSICDATL